MHRRELIAALLTGLASACAPNADPVAPAPRGTPRVKSRGEARARLAELAARYEQTMREHGAYEWARYAGKLDEGAEAKRKMAALRAAERDVFVEARGILRRFGEAIVSPRRADMWMRGAFGLDLLGDPRASELADELEAVINSHRYELDGRVLTSAEILDMRRSDDPRVRRRTRQLDHQLHLKCVPIATELVARRRALARELGKPSYWAALLEVRGVKVATLERHFNALDRGTRRPFFQTLAAGRARAFGRPLLFPWDLDHRVKELAPIPEARFAAEAALPTAYRLYRAFGADLENLGVTIRDFAFGGQTIAVQVPDDVRLVVRPLSGLKFYALLIHELGHAFAATRTRTNEPLYKAYEWIPGLVDPAFAEGVAETFSRMLDVPAVLTRFVGLSADDAAAVARRRKLETLVGIRRSLVAISFERSSLERDGNLDQIALDAERRFSGTIVPRDAEPVWAASAMLATYPVYVQSYMLAAMMALQVRAALSARFGTESVSEKAGAWLAERLVSDGARWTLDEKLVATTGSVLDSSELLRYLITP
jgi:hypothetical protein